MLFLTGAINRKGAHISDSSPEATQRSMGVEVTIAACDYEDVHLTFLDCPGSIEFAQETYNALVGAGTAIVVCEPDLEKVLILAPVLKFLNDWRIPHLLFVNKMNRGQENFQELLEALTTIAQKPLVPQQYPIWQNHELVGYIDLVTEQAYHYHPHSPADPVPFPAELGELEKIARANMLEAMANFDDQLLEELLEDIEPPQAEIMRDLKQELSADQIVPVFFGMADQDYGVRPLLDALKKEAPAPNVTAERRGLTMGKDEQTIIQILKTYLDPQGGKLSVVRVWQGQLKDGMTLGQERIGSLYHLLGSEQTYTSIAEVGEIVAINRLNSTKTGDTLAEGEVTPLPKAQSLKPVYALAVMAKNRQDEVKLAGALDRLKEEDPSLHWEHHGDTREIILWGQGEIHLQVALARLERKYKIAMVTELPKIPYKETIKKGTSSHGRYKHQSGGHGAFGDVYLDIKPVGRGEGFHFHETIVGGVVPRQYIPGVEKGVKEYLAEGPLGFPIVDIDVTLTNGSFHAVDSSEQAFRQAARIAMTEAMPACTPQLLEPILLIQVSIPNEFTSRALQLVSSRRGQILGYEGITDWKNWDQVSGYLPQSEMHDFIIELRSLTLGVGSFDWQYDHLQEVPDKVAQKVLRATEA
jgi:elongation factor G